MDNSCLKLPVHAGLRQSLKELLNVLCILLKNNSGTAADVFYL